MEAGEGHPLRPGVLRQVDIGNPALEKAEEDERARPLRQFDDLEQRPVLGRQRCRDRDAGPVEKGDERRLRLYVAEAAEPRAGEPGNEALAAAARDLIGVVEAAVEERGA